MRLKQYQHRRSGNVMLLVAVSLVALLSVAGLVLDKRLNSFAARQARFDTDARNK
jgi:hypothetical protein